MLRRLISRAPVPSARLFSRTLSNKSTTPPVCPYELATQAKKVASEFKLKSPEYSKFWEETEHKIDRITEILKKNQRPTTLEKSNNAINALVYLYPSRDFHLFDPILELNLYFQHKGVEITKEDLASLEDVLKESNKKQG